MSVQSIQCNASHRLAAYCDAEGEDACWSVNGGGILTVLNVIRHAQLNTAESEPILTYFKYGNDAHV